MPSTITTFHEFQPGTKARASQVNTNFSNFRGDFIPIYETTAAASNNEHHLGATDHRWLNVYCNVLDLKSSTTTAMLQLVGDTSATAGAFLFQIASTTVARVTPSGFAGSSLADHSVSDTQLGETTRTLLSTVFNANGTYTVPTGTARLLIEGMGGGGGGGGGGGDGGAAGSGGGGGGGTVPVVYSISVTAGDVLSITVGSGGAGGVHGATTGATGSSGTASTVVRSGTTLITFFGAPGGGGGQGDASTATGAQNPSGGLFSKGGDNAVDGVSSPYAAGGSKGTGGSGGVGGGGGAGRGAGANGGTSGGGSAGSSAAANSGAGGGGGGASNGGGGNGGSGGSGGSGQIIITNLK